MDTLCLDVPPEEFERECAFWAAFTGQADPPRPGPWFRLPDPAAGLAGAPAAAATRQRRPRRADTGHVDLGCTDPGAQARHLSLGARLVAKQQYWTVLADPAGHEYCLIGREPV